MNRDLKNYVTKQELQDSFDKIEMQYLKKTMAIIEKIDELVCDENLNKYDIYKIVKKDKQEIKHLYKLLLGLRQKSKSKIKNLFDKSSYIVSPYISVDLYIVHALEKKQEAEYTKKILNEYQKRLYNEKKDRILSKVRDTSVEL